MTVELLPTGVRISIDVDASIDHVFETFTTRMASWRDPAHYLIKDLAEAIVDPYVGGRITEVGADGSHVHLQPRPGL